jgi:hypothetical protein
LEFLTTHSLLSSRPDRGPPRLLQSPLLGILLLTLPPPADSDELNSNGPTPHLVATVREVDLISEDHGYRFDLKTNPLPNVSSVGLEKVHGGLLGSFVMLSPPWPTDG